MSERLGVKEISEFHHQIKDNLQLPTDGRMIDLVGNDDSLDFIDVDELVREVKEQIEDGGEPTGFVIEANRYGVPVPRPGALAMGYYGAVATWISRDEHPDRHKWSSFVWAARKAVREIGVKPGMFPPDYLVWCLRDADGVRSEHLAHNAAADAFNRFLGKIAEILGLEEFARRLNSSRHNARRNLKSARAVEQKAFKAHEQCFVSMLCLGFDHRYRNELRLKEMKKFRSKFFNNRGSNTLLRGIVGYIWRFDDDEITGLHFHLIIFYAPQLSTDDIATQIGEYWKNNVTGGKGAYWFCTAYTASHTKDGHPTGVGKIDRDNAPARAALCRIIRCMVEMEQIVKMNSGDRSHLFGTSQDTEK